MYEGPNCSTVPENDPCEPPGQNDTSRPSSIHIVASGSGSAYMYDGSQP